MSRTLTHAWCLHCCHSHSLENLFELRYCVYVCFALDLKWDCLQIRAKYKLFVLLGLACIFLCLYLLKCNCVVSWIRNVACNCCGKLTFCPTVGKWNADFSTWHWTSTEILGKHMFPLRCLSYTRFIMSLLSYLILIVSLSFFLM